jgi:maltose alpha-D-glucosyltransferase / alpha-amylase
MGDNIYLGDRNAVRTPMQWSGDRNAGFSRANPQGLFLPVIIDPEYHFETVNVEAQARNPHSLLWWTRRLIALRKRFRAFGRGTLEFLFPENRKVLAFVRRYESERILVVANVSRFVQYVELDLKEFRGCVPVELFGRTDFPPIGDLPYLLTLGPHAFYWFSLEHRAAGGATLPHRAGDAAPILAIEREPAELFLEDGSPARHALEHALPAFLQTRRWFGGKARRFKVAHLVEAVPLGEPEDAIWLAVVGVDFHEGTSDRYLLPLAVADGERAATLLRFSPQAIVARLRLPGSTAGDPPTVLYDALEDATAAPALYDLVVRARRARGWESELSGSTTRAFRRLRPPEGASLSPVPVRADQTHSSIAFGDRFVLKVFRRFEEGVNPETEVGRFLGERARFTGSPIVAGALELGGASGKGTVAVLHQWHASETDGWTYAVDSLSGYFDRLILRGPEAPPLELPPPPDRLPDGLEPKPLAFELVGPFLHSSELLGRRTGELHLALTSDGSDEDFEPEPFSSLYQRSLYQAMRNAIGQVFQMLRERRRHLSESDAARADRLLPLEATAVRRCETIRHRKVTALRARIHGDYHLKQVLWTGKDFVIIDFEGEPARPLGERRIKRSPLRDVAGMLRSFEYAAEHACRAENGGRRERLDPNAMTYWSRWISAAFLRGYFEVARRGRFLPNGADELEILLDLYLLDKAIYELRYELENRPAWVGIPLAGILALLEEDG